MAELIQKKLSQEERNARRRERMEKERLAKIAAIPDTLHGAPVVEIPYTAVRKKTVKAMRREFTDVRKEFLKHLAETMEPALREMGLSDKAIAGMMKGESPSGFNTHHKIPLAGGGQNVFENLILIKNDPYHTDFHEISDPQICVLKEGQTAAVRLPMPEGSVFIPPKEQQKTQETAKAVPNAAFLKKMQNVR